MARNDFNDIEYRLNRRGLFHKKSRRFIPSWFLVLVLILSAALFTGYKFPSLVFDGFDLVAHLFSGSTNSG